MEGTDIHFQPDRYLLVGQFLFLAAGFGRKVRYVWQNRLSLYMTQERYIKVNPRLRTTAPFKAAPYIVDRISIQCQMVVVTIWHIFLFSFAGILPPNCIRGPPGFELYSMKLKIQEVYND